MNQSNLTIGTIREHRDKHSYIVLDPNDFFEEGLIIDAQSLNLIVKVYEALNDDNKAKFNDVLQTDYKLAKLLSKMWGWVA